MNRDPYATALNNALTEIQKAYPDITHSFIFAEDGSTIAGETENDPQTLKKVSESFEELKTKVKSMGNITSYSVNCENGKLHMTNINNVYFMLATNSNADVAQIYSLTHVVIPPLMKTLQLFAGQTSAPSTPENALEKTNNNDSSNLQNESTMKLIVKPVSGFFARNAVQIDEMTLKNWSDNEANGEEIKQVKIETLQGESTVCKVKKISVDRMKGKCFIRMPIKICNILKVKGGDRVNASPDL